MTDLDERAPSQEAADTRRNLGVLAGAGLVAVVAVGLLLWIFLFRDTSAKSVDTEAAEQARQDAIAEATTTTLAESDDPAASDVAGSDDPVESPGLDGTWMVDTSFGTFDDACLSDVCDATFVGFRIDEELARIGAKTVVGRTPGVVGSMEIEGTTIVAAEMVVDMTQLITDSGSRTSALRDQAIETRDFPESSFVLTEPIDLGEIPGDGERIEISATGDLTIHGVTRTETIPLQANLAGDVIVVFGELGPILLADYDISKPSAAVVLSVEDNAIMELQLFFTR